MEGPAPAAELSPEVPALAALSTPCAHLSALTCLPSSSGFLRVTSLVPLRSAQSPALISSCKKQTVTDDEPVRDLVLAWNDLPGGDSDSEVGTAWRLGNSNQSCLQEALGTGLLLSSLPSEAPREGQKQAGLCCQWLTRMPQIILESENDRRSSCLVPFPFCTGFLPSGLVSLQ